MKHFCIHVRVKMFSDLLAEHENMTSENEKTFSKTNVGLVLLSLM